MTLDEALKEVESRYKCVDGDPYHICQTGDSYVVLCSGGLKDEGKPCPAYYSTPDLAIKAWLDAFNNYSKGLKGVLYWRVRPEIMKDEVIPANAIDWPKGAVVASTVMWYVVYSRLVISDKEEVKK